MPRRLFFILTLIFFALSFPCAKTYAQSSSEDIVRVVLIDTSENAPLAYAACTLHNLATQREYAAVASSEGVCRWSRLPKGTYFATVVYMGRAFPMGKVVVGDTAVKLSFNVNVNPEQIEEVVVTAAESQGITNSSSVGREAMSHIQPSSIGDLLSLLPGGKSIDPSLAGPQQIRLREAGAVSSEDYATTALGTSYVIDGVPMNTDANMQSMEISGGMSVSSGINRGVDTRTISTDDIESVEIIRGIPSVEYGDLTSGLIRVKRKQGGRDLSARFKADMSSKLLYLGKGFEWNRGKDKVLTMNMGVDYLDSHNDPRNVRQNYSRATAMYRVGYDWKVGDYKHSISANIDYTGSFDRKKSDADMDFGTSGRPIETYKADYNRVNLMGSWQMRPSGGHKVLRSLEATGSVTNEVSIAENWRYVSLGSELPLSTTLTEGEHDVITLPAQYEANLRIESKPFYAFLKSMAILGFNTVHSDNTFKVGAEWRMDKNFGRGYIFDVTRPITPSMNLRPRAYNSIPAKHSLSAFAEALSNVSVGNFDIAVMLGVRSTTIMNLGKEYALNGKTYFDPRANVKVSMPSIMVGSRPLVLSVAGGVGWHTKMPTMSQLFPSPFYFDIQQMNYWPTNPELRRINVLVNRIDPTNFQLLAARNLKWEARFNALWNGFSLSVTYFNEDMKSGFRNGERVEAFHYKRYDTSSLDHSSLTAPPSLEDTPYVRDTTLVVYSTYNNGSRTRKEGVEFIFSTKRIRAIRTKLTVTGAYFRTVYSNSVAEMRSPSVTINGKAYPYVGCYEVGTQNYERETFNTNFMFDTQIPKLGLIFTTSFECTWFTASRNMPYSAYPIYYLDKDLQRHEFTEASAQDGVLAHMVRTANEMLFRRYKVPFAMDVNLKITKRLFKNKASVSMFVNRIVHYYPVYESNGATIRRSAVPYFGMELNLKL